MSGDGNCDSASSHIPSTPLLPPGRLLPDYSWKNHPSIEQY